MVIARKLEEVHQDLTQLTGQGIAVGFLTNNENAQRINGLVEDIREVIMDYQVCMLNYFFLTCLMFVLDLTTTRHLQQELSADCESHPPAFCLCGLTDE
jgi:hypothetical protein